MPEKLIPTKPRPGKQMLSSKNILIKLSFIFLMFFSQLLLAKPVTIRVAVAANFAPVLTQLLPEFTEQTNINVQLIKGATGTLFQQIKHGAPFDVYMAADSLRPQQLAKQQLATTNSVKTYAAGRLAYWSATISPQSLSYLSEKNQRLAIANPNVAPYGKAAKEVLEHLNLWQKYQNNLVTGINISQTFQQVRSKAVSSGIVALSQLKLNNLTGLEIPADHYRPINQQMLVLKSSKQQQAAQQFLNFILSETSQSKIAQFGYHTGVQ